MNLGVSELLIIGAVVVLLFGTKKLPTLGLSLGQAIKNFKSSVNDAEKTIEIEAKDQKLEKKDQDTLSS